MQIIGTRPGSTFRVDATWFRDKKARFQVGIDPQTRGPVRVVNDYTDEPADCRKGYEWVIETDPESPEYARPVLRKIPKHRLEAEATA